MYAKLFCADGEMDLRTDTHRHGECNSHISQLWERGSKLSV